MKKVVLVLGALVVAGCTTEQWDRIGAAGRVLSNADAAYSYQAPQPAHPHAGQAAFLKGQEVSGMSRICTYDRLGSPYVITQSAASVCAPMVQ